MTDALQILAASALPAISTLFGLKLPEDAGTLVLAYIGLAALTFFAIRLLWAPYSIWKEQAGEISRLQIELSKPERMVMERLARHRAKARAKLAAKLEDFQTLSFYEEVNFAVLAPKMAEIRRLQASAGLSDAFETGRCRFLVVVQEEAKQKNSGLSLDRKSNQILKLLQRYLVGEVTAETLALQLPSDLRPGTRQ